MAEDEDRPLLTLLMMNAGARLRYSQEVTASSILIFYSVRARRHFVSLLLSGDITKIRAKNT